MNKTGVDRILAVERPSKGKYIKVVLEDGTEMNHCITLPKGMDLQVKKQDENGVYVKGAGYKALKNEKWLASRELGVIISSTAYAAYEGNSINSGDYTLIPALRKRKFADAGIKVSVLDKGQYVKITAEKKYPLFSQLKYTLQQGNSIHPVTILCRHLLPKDKEKELTNMPDKGLARNEMRLLGWTNHKTAEHENVSAWKLLGNMAFVSKVYYHLLDEADKQVKKNGAVTIDKLMFELGLEDNAQKDFIKALEARGFTSSKKMIIADQADSKLSPFAKAMLEKSREKGKRGIDAASLSDNELKVFHYLVDIGEVYLLHDQVFVSKAVVKELGNQLLSGKRKGDKLTVDEAKVRLQMKRKYVIGLLELMNQEEILQRIDDEHIVKQSRMNQ
ncbi:MAG: SelB C-terminal domain-containing protein [Spirochaetia bacterium]